MVLSVVKYVPKPWFMDSLPSSVWGFVVQIPVNLCVWGYIYTVQGTASIWKQLPYDSLCATLGYVQTFN